MTTERTADKWLAIPVDDLPVKLAEALIPEPWKHKRDERGKCLKCERHVSSVAVYEPVGCNVPNPIDIKDRTAAIELIRKLFATPRAQSDYIIELVDVCDEAPIDYLTSDPDFMLWLLFVASVSELLIAAAMAERSKE